MKEHIVWRVSPAESPKLIRCCGRCAHMSFISSGQFRVNANGNCLDVWLVYKCERCNATWNMQIYSRVRFNGLGKQLYERFVQNDAALALQYSLDKLTLRQNRSAADYGSLKLKVSGGLPVDFPCVITVRPVMPLDVTLAKIFASKLAVSQNEIAKMEQQGMISCAQSLRKTKLKKEIKVLWQGIEKSDNTRLGEVDA